LPASPVSHVVCTAALVILIFTMQFYYLHVVDNIWVEMVERELKEIADYVSDTLANLYFLANSTKTEVTLIKTLSLPSDVRDSTYIVKIVKNEATGFAQSIHVYLKGRSGVDATSWILPGLKIDEKEYTPIESGGKTVVAGCSRTVLPQKKPDIYVWIGYKQA